MGCSVYQYHVFYTIFASLLKLKKQRWYTGICYNMSFRCQTQLCTVALVLGPPEEDSVLSNMHANHILNRGAFSHNLTASSFQSWQAKKTLVYCDNQHFLNESPRKRHFFVNFLWPLRRTDAKMYMPKIQAIQGKALFTSTLSRHKF